MEDYSQIIRDHLVSEGFSNVFAGTEKPPNQYIPQASIFCAEYGGGQPESMFGTSEQIHTILVQIMVRSDPDDEQGALNTARQVYDSIRNTTPGGVMVVRPNAPPIRLGVDEDRIYRFTINISISNQE